MSQRFSYQAEKLCQARSSLMAPHPGGEDLSFQQAFNYCSRALHDLNLELVDDDGARGWIAIIERVIDTTGIEDTTGEGLWFAKARSISCDEKSEFSHAVDELASYFDMEFWRSGTT